MTKIRNFVYLDEKKLRSFSSQLFEGVTEKIILGREDSSNQTDEQKGPVGSGRIIADIFTKSSSFSDHKFLDDFAYSLFEDKVIDCDLVSYGLDHSSTKKPFSLVTGRMLFGDSKSTRELINKFNDIGLSFHLLSHLSGVSTSTKKMSNSERQSAASEAAKNGLQFNEDFLRALSTLFEFGFSDSLEAKLAVEGTLFSAPIKRSALRDSEVEIIQRYSRISEREFTLLGTVTQSEKLESPPEFGPSGSATMRDQIVGMASAMRVVEDQFFGRAGNEIIIDPIAIYTSL